MRRVLIGFVVPPLLCCAMACSHGLDLQKAPSQVRAGAEAARINLWREAMFRFQRAVQMNPSDARALNDLAVAYEGNGEFEKARDTYTLALRLDKSNQYIQKNYRRFVEFYTKYRKRDAAATAAANAPKASTPDSKPAGPAAVPQPGPPQPLPHPEPPTPPVSTPPPPAHRGGSR